MHGRLSTCCMLQLLSLRLNGREAEARRAAGQFALAINSRYFNLKQISSACVSRCSSGVPEKFPTWWTKPLHPLGAERTDCIGATYDNRQTENLGRMEPRPRQQQPRLSCTAMTDTESFLPGRGKNVQNLLNKPTDRQDAELV